MSIRPTAIIAAQLIDGFRALIQAAHARGIRVVGATILPFKASYDSGDHLHPDDAGYRAIAASIDLVDL